MNKITIFGRPGCGFCSQAKKLCEINKLECNYVDIWAEGISQADLQKTVGKHVSTVPQVFYGRQHIGGFTEFADFVHKLLKTSASVPT